jgi:hypothetical protein
MAEALTRRELAERYGSEHFDEATALRMVGHAEIPVSVVYASVYRSREAAEAYAAANLEHYGHPSLGIIQLIGEEWAGRNGHFVGVTDLRPAIAAAEARRASGGRQT